MKKYHIYGMGNALVDMEFQVDDQFLQRLNIDKGHMTLISQERKIEILNALGKDMMRSCGGSAANSLIAAAQWGAKTFYSCKVGNDEEGVFYLDDLKRQQVDSLNKTSAGTTGKCLVLVTPDAQRSLNTFLGISEYYSPQEIASKALQESETLYIEGYLVASPSAYQATVITQQQAHSHQVRVALTFSDVNIVAHFRKQITSVLENGVDLLFSNVEEILAFTGKQEVAEAMALLQSLAQVVVATRGAQGAIIYDGQQYLEVAGKPVEAIDTNGAGDMFAGAFLAALTQGKDLQTAGQFACLCAGHIVQKWGPRMSEEEVRAVEQQASTLGV